MSETISDPLRVLISTDAFPPVCGGSGWSTYELARALRATGHHVVVTRPRVDRSSSVDVEVYDGFQVLDYQAYSPNIPYVRNYFKSERLSRRYGNFLRTLIRAERISVVHAQHRLSGPPSIAAANAEGIPVVCTVRDYWPICYWSDLIHDYKVTTLCPGCSTGMMTQCVRPRAGLAWPLALPMIPYMKANLSMKRRALSQTNAVIAVSTSMAENLRERAPELHTTRIEQIPNPINVEAVRKATMGSASPLESPYALYVGKLATNKGSLKLISVLEQAKLDRPLVIVGDGPDRPLLENLAKRSNCDIRFMGWLPRVEALCWMRHASVLIFPSHGPESLSRVLLEAAALGTPIAAMDTGGTRDIITDEETGLLSNDVDKLSNDVNRLINDAGLRQRLGQAAKVHVEAIFDAEIVAGRVVKLYRDLIESAALR